MDLFGHYIIHGSTDHDVRPRRLTKACGKAPLTTAQRPKQDDTRSSEIQTQRVVVVGRGGASRRQGGCWTVSSAPNLKLDEDNVDDTELYDILVILRCRVISETAAAIRRTMKTSHTYRWAAAR
ncbi:hypothetical protein QTP88_002491 [Uroleucon formosanum]